MLLSDKYPVFKSYSLSISHSPPSLDLSLSISHSPPSLSLSLYLTLPSLSLSLCLSHTPLPLSISLSISHSPLSLHLSLSLTHTHTRNLPVKEMSFPISLERGTVFLVSSEYPVMLETRTCTLSFITYNSVEQSIC